MSLLDLFLERHLIRLTQRDIETGEPRSGLRCPLAFAISRAIGIPPESEEVWVDVDGIRILGRIRFRRASGPLPRAARRFIRRFDERRAVRPLEFRIAIEIPRTEDWR